MEAKLENGVLDGSVSVPDRWTLTASGDLFGDPARLAVALDARDLASVLLFTPVSLPPGQGGALALEGELTLPSAPGQKPSGEFTVTEARLDLPDRPGVLRTSGNLRVTLRDGRLLFDEFQAVGEGTRLAVRGSLALEEPRSIGVSASGEVDAALLSLFSPGVGLSGRLLLDLSAGGTLAAPELEGTVRIENGKYRLADLALIFDDIDGSIRLHGAGGEIDGIRARVGGGEAYAAGSFRIEKGSLRDFRVTLQGRRVSLRYPADMRLVVDADLVATGNAEGNAIRGEVVLLRGTYSRDFEVTLSALLERTRPSDAAAAREPWKERTTLEVHIVSAAALEVRNNLARLTATVDLVARGTVADPTLLGQIVLDEGGRITFRDVRYEIESGTITFASAGRIAPILDLRARAEVKGYDLVVNLVGSWPRIQTTFSSDPPLPDDAVVGLLLTGADPTARGAQPDAGGSLVSAAGGIVAGAVTGGITRGTQRIFKLDRFQIAQVFTGSQLTDVRSTVGKQITPDLAVTYTQSLDSSREPVVQMEWRVTDTVLVQALRDENGVYSINFRRRQRY
jgi:translocation and assembly module TamB